MKPGEIAVIVTALEWIGVDGLLLSGEVEETEQYEFEYTLSGGLPDGHISALIDHVRTFLGKEELIELVRHTLVVFRLTDRSIDARHKRILVRP